MIISTLRAMDHEVALFRSVENACAIISLA
jgi:hypothetical protein